RACEMRGADHLLEAHVVRVAEREAARGVAERRRLGGRHDEARLRGGRGHEHEGARKGEYQRGAPHRVLLAVLLTALLAVFTDRESRAHNRSSRSRSGWRPYRGL